TVDAMCVVGRDLRNRAQGLMAEAISLFAGGKVDDHTLGRRVHSRIDRAVSHPGAVEVRAQNGRVTLSGPVLAQEGACLLDAAGWVRGVSEVVNNLVVHQEPGNVPALQGEGHRPGSSWDLMQERWSPATRALVGLTGGTLFAFGLTRRAPTACVLGTVGLALAGEGLTNMGFGEMVGRGERRGIQVQKTITINAPALRAFQFWTNSATFPRFMTNVREVTYLGNGRSHWVAAGPAGVPVEWDARVTRFEPNRELAWESIPGSTVEQRGSVRFEPAEGGTRATV